VAANQKRSLLKNLAFVIQARMEEIVEHVYYEIKSSGYEKKLIAGIVVTGGGAQLKHLTQLIEYVTGLDCRVGYPNEHLAKNEVLPKNIYEELQSPTFATGIGLLIKGIQKMEYNGLTQVPEAASVKAEKTKYTDDRKFGLLGKILESGKKFIKDDIKDEDFLK
jgi:cell division protein FtsA